MTDEPPITIAFSPIGMPDAKLPFKGWDESIVMAEAERFLRAATSKGIRLVPEVEAHDHATETRLLSYFCNLYGELIADGVPPLDKEFVRKAMREQD